MLLDSCVWGKALVAVEAAGHDAVWAGAWDRDPGDEEILRTAHRESRIVVTLDRDFGQLAIELGRPHSGIIRLAGLSARDQGTATVEVLARYGDELVTGAIVTVEPGRVRVRSA